VGLGTSLALFSSSNPITPFTWKGAAMNKDILAGKWKEMKGRVKEQWGKITDDELDRAEGRAEQMIGLLQQRYGYSKERAQEEYDRFMRDQETGIPR
jgi:uncharacterized protein YjbJ (UPF0337 family)